MEKIIPGKHVSLVYDLYAVAPDGAQELVHQSDPEDPEQIIFGVTQGVIAPLERALDGLEKGAEFDVVANSEEAFGPHVPEQVVTLDKDMFLVDGKFDTEMIAVGKYVPMLTAEGYRINGLVLEIADDKVKLDFNHPLAGKTIRFKGKVQDVRDATEEELHIAAGNGCGCGCHGEDCGDGCGCGDKDADSCGCHDKKCGCSD